MLARQAVQRHVNGIRKGKTIGIADHDARRLGHSDVSRFAHRCNTGRLVHDRADKVTVVLDDITGMDADPNAQLGLVCLIGNPCWIAIAVRIATPTEAKVDSVPSRSDFTIVPPSA